ncbi:MAG: glycosyltransferase family 39 protein [Verrucomicrobiota bacterium]|nr:glycosyltransferase family 39 protein [Verrucomicrobiota bacterium]
MAFLRAMDSDLLHFVSLNLRHPALDGVMRFLSGNVIFGPILAALAVWLLGKGGRRGRVLVLMLAVILPLGDGLVINPLKHAIGRERPMDRMTDARLASGKTDGRSMPSAHTATWFAATMIAFFYYRRSWRVMLPLATAVAFSRVYLGAHYPADVLVGAIIGSGYAVAGLVGLNALWLGVGRRWFPLWWRQAPSLLHPELEAEAPGAGPDTWAAATPGEHWLRLGCVVIVAATLGRLVYIAGGAIEMSKDEAYQWLWSKHLALSYYSKPPLIAGAQWLGTSIGGDTAFGVRFLSPLIGAAMALLLLRWMARLAGGRTAFWLLLVLSVTPLLAAGTMLLTIDSLLVMFWTVAMVLGWRAVQEDATIWHWLGVGLAMGLAFLSKYSALYQVVCWGLFFALWAPARAQLRRPGPWLALMVVLLSMTPVLAWNVQNHWVTLSHVSDNAGLGERWKPSLHHLLDFTGAELVLLNPVFLVAALWAMVRFWKLKPEGTPSPGSASACSRRGLMVYLFCMGAPVFIGHWIYTLHSQVQPNWIAPAAVPLLCLMTLYWERRWREGARGVVGWLRAGLILGVVAMVLLLGPGLVEKVIGKPLPPDKDPLRRIRAWKATTGMVSAARARLLAEGKPVFIVAHHYGLTGLLSFYLPEARPVAGREPLVYSILGPIPENQFFFWPEYRYQQARKGQNALYVAEADLPRYPLAAWFRSVLTGKSGPLPAKPAPTEYLQPLALEFESIKDLGVFPILDRGGIYRWVQLVECRNLR